MVVEYMDGGSLQDIIDTGGCDVEGILAQISYRILKGLEFIHTHKQIHRDIKPANLLINHLGQVKVSDFGIVRDLESTQAVANTFVGTLTYMSPERISGGTYGYNSDVWSFGLSLMTCALGKYPLGTSGGYWGILNSVNEEPLPTLPEDKFSELLRDFVNRCLSRDPAERPSVADLLNHPYLAGCAEQVKQEDEQYAESIQSILRASSQQDEMDEEIDVSFSDVCRLLVCCWKEVGRRSEVDMSE
jgi:serine/threonine protein kinase